MEASQAIAIRNRIIGLLVKRARIQAGKTQQDCASFLSCSLSAFSQYEQGHQGMSLPQLEALAYLFDVSPNSLWDEDSARTEETSAEELPLAQMMFLRRKILAVQFRQCRQSAGLTEEETGQMLGLSASTISEYEQGQHDIPLAELEIVAEHCDRGVTSFFDDQTIPLGPSEQNRLAMARLNELPPDVRDFVLHPTNALYMRIAMALSGLKADSLRQIAETILDITY
jgi:transcriptional regulator with XRE-family HTH domain